MPIRIEQQNLASLYGRAAILAGRAQRGREKEQIAERRLSQLRSIEAQKESQQMQIEQQRSMRLLDAQLDLEMYERSKRWEIDKMQLRSQVDFQREEQKRGRKIDDAENATLQIEKEIKEGRFDEDDPRIKNLLLYYSLQAQFPDRAPPTGLLRTPREEKIDPMQHLIQELLKEDEVEGVPGTAGRIRVISPEGQTGTIEARELETYKARGFRVIGGERTPTKKPTVRKPTPKLKPYGTVYREWL